MRGRFARVLVLVLAISPPCLAEDRQASKPRIEPMHVRLESGRLAVSFGVQDGLSDSTLERIHAGLPTIFRHSVEVLSRRAVPLLPSKVLASGTVEASASYDSLTRHYELRRKITVRRHDGDPAVREESRSSASEEEMRAFMTECPELVLLVGLDAQPLIRARVRAESSLERRYLLLLIPSFVKVAAERRLEP